MKDRTKTSKLLAVLWTILAVLVIVYATKQFYERPETSNRVEDFVIFLCFALPYPYIAVLNWRSYFKVKSKNEVKEIKAEQQTIQG